MFESWAKTVNVPALNKLVKSENNRDLKRFFLEYFQLAISIEIIASKRCPLEDLHILENLPIMLTYMSLLLAKNRKALHDHTLVEKYVAGIVLRGYEVKAIREQKVSFEGSYIQILKNIPYIVNLHIGEYSKKSQLTGLGDAKRNRELLLNAREIEEIRKELDQKGKTAVPLALVMNKNLIKLEFAVVKGKKEFEMKQTAKEKQIKKDLEVASKDFRQASDI